MKAIVDPATTTIFAVGGDVDPANGPDAAKVPAARWAEALAAAQKLKAPAANLNSPANKAKGPVWAKSAADFARLTATLKGRHEEGRRGLRQSRQRPRRHLHRLPFEIQETELIFPSRFAGKEGR